MIEIPWDGDFIPGRCGRVYTFLRREGSKKLPGGAFFLTREGGRRKMRGNVGAGPIELRKGPIALRLGLIALRRANRFAQAGYPIPC